MSSDDRTVLVETIEALFQKLSEEGGPYALAAMSDENGETAYAVIVISAPNVRTVRMALRDLELEEPEYVDGQLVSRG